MRMHEMSLAENIVQIAEQTARANGGGRIGRVLVEVGLLAGVEIDALRFCFEAATSAGLAAGASLVIEQPAGQAWCMPCGATVALAGLGEPCPRCGSHQLQVTGGTELRLKEIELH
jgi:hydrogenase nickel incorporation protein HypA/HybF